MANGYTDEWLQARLRGEPLPKTRAKRGHPEDDQQISLFEWARYVTVGSRCLADLLFHVPNGGSRHPAEAGKLSALGVKPGIPDLVLDVPAGAYHGGRWELKVGANKLTDKQIERHQMLREFGYYVNTCWSWEEAAADIRRYLSRGNFTVIERARISAR